MPLILPKLLQRLVLYLDLCSALGSAIGTAIELAIVAAPGTGYAPALALAYMQLATTSSQTHVLQQVAYVPVLLTLESETSVLCCTQA